MTVQELQTRLSDPNPPIVVDVRDDEELEISSIAGAVHIPMSSIADRLHDLDPAREYAVLCRSGGRSGKVVEFLRAQGFSNVNNVEGGINAWADQIDPSLTIY